MTSTTRMEGSSVERQDDPDSKTHSDHEEYFRHLERSVRAAGGRVAMADPEDLVLLVRLRRQVDLATYEAVRAQHRAGFSWSEIGRGLGITRQAAQERFSLRPTQMKHVGGASTQSRG